MHHHTAQASRLPPGGTHTPRTLEMSGATSTGVDTTPTARKPARHAKPTPAYAVPGIIVASIVSSVALILTNKHLMHAYGFKAVFLLSGTHFMFGGAALTAASKCGGLFQLKSIGLRENLLVGAAGVASIGFMNFSLLTNSVGTYQLFKMAVIPAVLAVQYAYYGKTASHRVLVSLGVLLVGVAIATVSDVQLRAVGLLFGAVAVASTAVFNIWQGTKQREHGVTSTQLLQSVSFYQGGIALVLGLYVEELASDTPVSAHAFSLSEVLLLLLSCVFATSVNMCSMGLIGRTSPVTYQVVGHVKTCLVLAGGYLLFPVPDNAAWFRNLFGVALALVGVFYYTYVRLQESAR